MPEEHDTEHLECEDPQDEPCKDDTPEEPELSFSPAAPYDDEPPSEEPAPLSPRRPGWVVMVGDKVVAGPFSIKIQAIRAGTGVPRSRVVPA